MSNNTARNEKMNTVQKQISVKHPINNVVQEN